MNSWLEKFNSLTRGMLFSDGYLSPSVVGDMADKPQRSETSVQRMSKNEIAAQAAKTRLAHTLFCGVGWINLR